MSQPMTSIPEILALGPVMPVIVIDDAAQAVPLATALLAGGIRTIEITLRTPAALDAIRAVAANCPQIIVGAGTVNNAALARQAREAGAAFAVTEMHPTPPCALKPCAVASSPEICRNSVPQVMRCWQTRARSPVASLTPTIRGSFASSPMVAGDMSTTDRPGML